MRLTHLLIFFSLFLLFLVPAQATVTHTATYGIANTDQAAFTDAIEVNGHLYFLMNSVIYDLNLTTKNFRKVFDAGFNYVLTSIIHDNSHFYVSGYKLYHPISGSTAPNHIAPVVTCPLVVQNYNIENFTVWKLSGDFAVQQSIVFNSRVLENISYHNAVQAMKLYDVSGQIYAVILDTSISSSSHVANIFQIDFANSQFVAVANLNKEYIQAVHGKDWVFLTDNNTVDIYDSNFALLKEYQDSQYNLRMKNVYADNNYIYLAGRGYDGYSWGAALEVITYNASIYYYMQFNNTYQFYSVYSAGKYAFVATNGTMYQIDYSNNTVTDEYVNALQSVYDLKTEKNVNIANYNPEAWTLVAYNNSGNLSFAWGGYYIDDSMMYAYMVITDKPSNIPVNPGGQDSGGGGWPFIPGPEDWSSIWTKYKWYIIAGGGLFLILVLSGGSRR